MHHMDVTKDRGGSFILAFVALGTLLSAIFNEYRPAISAVLGIPFIR